MKHVPNYSSSERDRARPRRTYRIRTSKTKSAIPSGTIEDPSLTEKMKSVCGSGTNAKLRGVLEPVVEAV
jgi:hypothetical protein